MGLYLDEKATVGNLTRASGQSLHFLLLFGPRAEKNTILWVFCGYCNPSQKQKIPQTQNQKM